jgi:outer membrane biosynthesis protein TonB
MRFCSIAVAALCLVACSRQDPDLTPEPVVNARVAPASELKFGDCLEARRRAAARPDLDVDRLPSPKAMKPPALQKVPTSALRRDGSAEVKIDVLVDTLGRADMKSFKVVTASHPWLADNVKDVIGKWRFTPAQLAGCKVARVYRFMASAPPKSARTAR